MEPTPYAKSMATIKSIEKNTFRDRTFGAFFGSFIGDATGAAVEKSNNALTKEQVELAMSMRGGTIFNSKQ